MAAFVIADEVTFRRDVKVQVPVDSGFSTQTLGTVFRELSEEKEEEFAQLMEAGSTTVKEFNKTFLRAVIKEFDNLKDTEKNPVPYSEEIRDQIIRKEYVQKALCEAYRDAMTGEKAKN